MRPFGYLFLLIITHNQYNVGQANPLIGMRIAEKTEYPFVVSICSNLTNTDIHLCGGSLITRKHVLTSAHCWEDLSHVVIKVGSNDLANAKKYSAKCWITYDEWARDNNIVAELPNNDISIIELSEKVSPFIKLARITKGFFTDFFGIQAVTAVWDVPWDNPNRMVLHTAVLNVISHDEWLKNFEKVTEMKCPSGICPGVNFLCTSARPSGALVNGDSGSPLLINKNEIIGIDDSSTKVYTDDSNRVLLEQNVHIAVDYYRTFINSVTDKKSAC